MDAEHLTGLERRIYELLQEHFARTDQHITLRQIAERLELKAWSLMYEAVRILAINGFVTKSPRNGRILGINHKCPTCGRDFPRRKSVDTNQTAAADDVGGAGAAVIRKPVLVRPGSLTATGRPLRGPVAVRSVRQRTVTGNGDP